MHKICSIATVLLMVSTAWANQGGQVDLRELDNGPYLLDSVNSAEASWSLPATGSIMAVTAVEYHTKGGWLPASQSVSIITAAHGMTEVYFYLPPNDDQAVRARVRTTFYYTHTRTGQPSSTASEFLQFVVRP